MRRRRLLLACCLLAAAAGPATPAARADGDPASDVLLAADAFYPYAPNAVDKPLQAALDGMLAQARAKKFQLKVALIAAAPDLGAVPQLLTEPQRYADLLTSEISFNTKPRVLVVLPSGLGGNNLGDGAGDALIGITPDAGDGGNGLARAAMIAVGRLTAANGTPVPVPAAAREGGAGDGSGDGGGVPPLVVFGVPVLLVVRIAGGAAIRGRGDEDEAEDDAAAGPDAPEPDGDDADAAATAPPETAEPVESADPGPDPAPDPPQ